jgi:hypothetical protein
MTIIFNGTTGLTGPNNSDGVINGVTVGKGGGNVSTNSILGYQALNSNTSGGNNTAAGYQAGLSNTTGTNNTNIGTYAGYSATTASDNTFVGYAAGPNVGTGTGGSNTGVGKDTSRAITTGLYNSALGKESLFSNTTGSYNIAIGYQAGYLGTTRGDCTFVGALSGFNTTGVSNVFVGYGAGYNATSGTYNTFVGIGAGENMTTGSKNTILGKYNGNQGSLDIRTANNNIVISDGDGNPRIYNNGQTTTFSAGAGGSVQTIADTAGITGGTTGKVGWTVASYSGQYIMGDVISSAAYGILGSDSGTSGWRIWTYSGGYAYRYQFNGNGAAYNTTGTWGTISDARIKQDVVNANSSWSDIKALEFKKYKLKRDVAFELSEENTKGYKAPTLFGLVAQEVQQTSPGLVEETDSDEVEDGKLLAIKTTVLLMKATKALQEAMERIEVLEEKVIELQSAK